MFIIGKSKIHGQGVIATRYITTGENIGQGIVYEKWFGGLFSVPTITPDLGQWINHSFNPNTNLVWFDNAWQIVTMQQVNLGDELTLNYSNTPWYIEGPLPHYS